MKLTTLVVQWFSWAAHSFLARAQASKIFRSFGSLISSQFHLDATLLDNEGQHHHATVESGGKVHQNQQRNERNSEEYEKIIRWSGMTKKQTVQCTLLALADPPILMSKKTTGFSLMIKVKIRVDRTKWRTFITHWSDCRVRRVYYYSFVYRSCLNYKTLNSRYFSK